MAKVFLKSFIFFRFNLGLPFVERRAVTSMKLCGVMLLNLSIS